MNSSSLNSVISQESVKSDPSFMINFEKKISQKFDILTNILALRYIATTLDTSGFVKPTRSVVKFPGIFRNDVYVKSHIKRLEFRKAQARKEELAFWISEGLNFGVVPTTYTAINHPDLVNRISRINMIASSNIATFSVIQEGVNTKTSNTKIDSKHASKVVLFNFIIGRYDADERNSVIDSQGRIFEIDNEHFGSRSSSSWIFKKRDMPLDQEVINDFLNVNPSNLKEILDKWESVSPFEPFWPIGDSNHPEPDHTKENILDNFSKIRSFLEMNRGETITVGNLITL